MKYTIESGGYVVHSSDTQEHDYRVLSGSLTIEMNRSGTLNFTVPPNNAALKDGHLKVLQNIIRVYQWDNNGGNKRLWKGRIVGSTHDFYSRMSFTCEGWLGVLNDICLSPFTQSDFGGMGNLDDTGDGDLDNDTAFDISIIRVKPKAMIEAVMKQYKDKNNSGTWKDPFYSEKQFSVEIDPYFDEMIVDFPNPNYEGVLDYLQTNILQNESVGGRMVLDGNTIKFLPDTPTSFEVSNQTVYFGENLLDISFTKDSSELRTYIHGSANDGNLVSAWASHDYIAKYGLIMRHVDYSERFDNKTKLEARMKKDVLENGFEKTSIDISAFDLSISNPSVGPLTVGTYIPVCSEPHNIKKMYVCTAATIDLINPANSKYTLGVKPDTLTAKQMLMNTRDLTSANYYISSSSSSLNKSITKSSVYNIPYTVSPAISIETIRFERSNYRVYLDFTAKALTEISSFPTLLLEFNSDSSLNSYVDGNVLVFEQFSAVNAYPSETKEYEYMVTDTASGIAYNLQVTNSGEIYINGENTISSGDTLSGTVVWSCAR